MSKKLFSILFLGMFFIKHWFVKLWKLITRPNQLKLFKRNFLNDNLIEFKKEEYEVIRALGKCVACGRCKYYNPFIDSTLSRYGLSPADIPLFLTRSQPDFIVIEGLARELHTFNLEEIYCPFGVPFKKGVELIINLNERLNKEKKEYGIA